MNYKTKEKMIQVYPAGGYVIAHVVRYDKPVEAYRVYKVLGHAIGHSEEEKDGKRIFNVSGVGTADKVVKIPFGNIEIKGVEIVQDEAEVRYALRDFITNEPFTAGKFNGRTLKVEGGVN